MQVLRARASMYDESGDHVTYVQLFEEWVAAHCSADWARGKFLSTRALNQAKRVRAQLEEMVQRAGGQQRSGSSGSHSGQGGRRGSSGPSAPDDRHPPPRRGRSRSPPPHHGRSTSSGGGSANHGPALDEFGRQISGSAAVARGDGRTGSGRQHQRSGRYEEQQPRRWDEGGRSRREYADTRQGSGGGGSRGRRQGGGYNDPVDERSLKSDSHRRLGVLDKETRRALVRCVLAGYYPQSAQLCAGDTYKLISGSHGGAGVGEEGLALDKRLTAKGDADESYQRVTSGSTLGTQLVFMHPSSALSVHAPPPFVVFHELVSTSRPHMRTISAVKSKYLLPLLPRLESVDLGRLCGRGTAKAPESQPAQGEAQPATVEASSMPNAGGSGPQSSVREAPAVPQGFFDAGQKQSAAAPATAAPVAASGDAKAAAIEAAKARALARAAARRG